MERQRLTRGRTRASGKEEKAKKGGSVGRPRKATTPTLAKRASPGRTKVSPVRRSSRPRSAAQVLITRTNTATPPSPIKEVKDEGKGSPSTRSNLPSTLTTNTSSRAPDKSMTSTSSVHSSYSSMTQKTVEIRSSAAVDDKIINKVKDYIRRSVSKSLGDSETRRLGDTDTESRYSRSVSRSVYEDDKSSHAEFSDTEEKKSTLDQEEEEEHYQSFSTTQQPSVTLTSSPPRRKIEAPREFGGAVGITLLLSVVPVLVYYLQWTCGKNSCGFKSLNFKAALDPKYLVEKVFPADAVGSYISFNLALFLLSGVLYGRHVRLADSTVKQSYNFNALSIAILITIAGGVAEYLKYPVADFVLRHYLHFCIYGFVNAFVVSLWCYFRTRLQIRDATSPLNPYAKTNNFLVDFGLGRQLNPKWFGLFDYKQAFYRISLLTTLVFAECFLYKKIQLPALPGEFSGNSTALESAKHYAENISYDAGAVLAASLLLFYILDAIIFEHHLISSFELQHEGFGCLLLLRYAATPYLLSGVAKYYFDRRMPTISNNYALIACWTLLVSGLILKRLSSAIKYKYRTSPTNPHFYGIETIHTFQGRRLLLDGFWGRLRQPNYTGDIIALIALATPLYMRFSWPPLISIGILIVLLFHRTLRVNERNIARYHSSWVRYCTKVPFFILPKIY